MDDWMDEWINNERTSEQKNERRNERMKQKMYEWAEERMNASRGEWKLVAIVIDPAGFRPRGRNPRRHSSIPRVIKECVGIVCENISIWKKLGAQGGIG